MKRRSYEKSLPPCRCSSASEPLVDKVLHLVKTKLQKRTGIDMVGDCENHAKKSSKVQPKKSQQDQPIFTNMPLHKKRCL